MASDETCWTMVTSAAGGDAAQRRDFARTYLPVVRAFLGARWRGSAYLDRLEDAVQDVFLDCFKQGGALGRVDPGHRARFRTFLYGVVRNVALRHEERLHRTEKQPGSGITETLEAREERVSVAFDRAWAQALVRRAIQRQAEAAGQLGPEAERRVELLRLRFSEGKPIRDIAQEWAADAAVLHRQYRKAREEFKEALIEEIRFHQDGTQGELERQCTELLDLLG